MVGYCVLNLSLPRGSSVYLRYSEYRQLKPQPNPLLDPFVNIDSSNYFNIAAEDAYIANGSAHGVVTAHAAGLRAKETGVGDLDQGTHLDALRAAQRLDTDRG